MDKEFRDMNDRELQEEFDKWKKHVEDAAGWSSAYFAARQLEAVCTWAQRRGLAFYNPYPVRKG